MKFKKMNRISTLSIIFSSVVLGFNSTLLSAQETDTAEVSDAETTVKSGGSEVEKIVVTARRREEYLLEVPGSVSAFTEEQLASLQATDMRRVQYAVPNFHFEKSDSSNAAVYLRGIGQNDSLPFVESGVGIYIDDVYVARSQAAFLELFDVERIEVLRGPQGTLYGRNSPGGAVKLITRQPTDSLEKFFQLDLGNYDLFTTSVRVSGPLNSTKSLKGKIALTHTSRDGFSQNVIEGGRDGDTNSFGWRGALVYDASDNLTLNLSVDGKIEKPERSLTPIRKTALTAFSEPVTEPSNPTVFLPTLEQFGSEYIVEGTANERAELKTYGITLKANWQLSDSWFLESISSYRDMTWDSVLDADGSPLPVLDIPVEEEADQFSSELRLAYDNGNDLAFTGGLFYFEEEDTVLSGFDDASASFEFAGVFLPLISVGAPTSGYGNNVQKTKSVAVFADVTFSFSEDTTLELGVRYTRDEKDLQRQNEFFFNPELSLSFDMPAFLSGAGFAGEELRGNESWDAFTPRVVLSHDLGNENMVYASIAKGFKSGGFPGRAFSAAEFNAFSPEKVWTYEAGIKGSAFDSKFNYSTAYFYNDYKDLQLNGFGQDPSNGQFISLFTNASSAKIQGVEAVISIRPLKQLLIDASAGYLDSEYENYETLVNGVLTDVSDRRLANSPKFTGFIGATYTEAVSDNLTGTFHVDLAYKGKFANETTDSPNLAVPSTLYLNAFISLGESDDKWKVRLGATNITDKARSAQSFNTAEFSGVETAFIGAPRLYYLSFLTNF